MRLLFLCYWGFSEGLTTATVVPHIKILEEFEEIKQIVFCSLENAIDHIHVEDISNKVKHVSIPSGNRPLVKFLDFHRIPRIIHGLCLEHKTDAIICRSTLAGALARISYKRSKIPYFVESFEPHADYMLKSGIWSNWNFRYAFLKRSEEAQKYEASGLMTVSSAYSRKLTMEGIASEKLRTVPCAVDTEQFRFNEGKRFEIRGKLGLSKDDFVGVYVGKFGGLYYDKEAYQLFYTIYKNYHNFRLIVLTSSDKDSIRSQLYNVGFKSSDFFIDYVPHFNVPDYLSASDFAFCLHRSHSSSFGFSPIKNGEYWANGLPILIPENIGDDSEIVISESAGGTYKEGNNASIKHAMEKIIEILQKPGSRVRIPSYAKKYRSFSKLSLAYRYFLFQEL